MASDNQRFSLEIWLRGTLEAQKCLKKIDLHPKVLLTIKNAVHNLALDENNKDGIIVSNWLNKLLEATDKPLQEWNDKCLEKKRET